MKENHINTKLYWKLIGEELSDPERQNALAHIDGCPKCQKEYEMRLSLHQGLKSMEYLQSSPQFSNQVMDLIHKNEKINSSLAFWDRLIRRAIVFSMVLCIGLLLTKFLTIPEYSEYVFYSVDFFKVCLYALVAIVLLWLLFGVDYLLNKIISSV